MLVSVLVLVLTLPTQIISDFSDFFFLSSCYRKCGKDCHVHVAASVVAYMTFENGGSGVPSFPFLKTILSQSAPVQKRFLSVPFFFLFAFLCSLFVCSFMLFPCLFTGDKTRLHHKCNTSMLQWPIQSSTTPTNSYRLARLAIVPPNNDF